jgi:sulfur-oxidizing protein SoxA
MPMMARIALFLLLACVPALVMAGPNSASSNTVHPMSGNAFLSPAMQAIQRDLNANPISLWLEQGKVLWGNKDKKGSCFECHGDIEKNQAMATQFPKWSDRLKRLINLEDQILICSQRTDRPLKDLENSDVLSLSAVMHQASSGLVFNLKPSDQSQKQWQSELNAGANLYTTRIGQMNLACTHCHDQLVGKQMRADLISPGHPTGFPIFKMSWQGMGTIDRRLRACYSGVQAELPASGSPELRQLELFLKVRAQGMPIEGPSLRR